MRFSLETSEASEKAKPCARQTAAPFHSPLRNKDYSKLNLKVCDDGVLLQQQTSRELSIVIILIKTTFRRQGLAVSIGTNRIDFTEDGDRFQSPKCRFFLLKLGRWTMSKKFVTVKIMMVSF
jgi:hypothetical protein